jgi:hypothetical protein
MIKTPDTVQEIAPRQLYCTLAPCTPCLRIYAVPLSAKERFTNPITFRRASFDLSEYKED